MFSKLSKLKEMTKEAKEISMKREQQMK